MTEQDNSLDKMFTWLYVTGSFLDDGALFPLLASYGWVASQLLFIIRQVFMLTVHIANST